MQSTAAGAARRRPGSEAIVILLDTGFFLALRNDRDPFHARAVVIGQEIMGGQHGRPVVSDYIFAEVLNFLSGRQTPEHRFRQVIDELLGRGGHPWVHLVRVGPEMFDAAVALFEKLGPARGLSFTDCSSIVLARGLGTSLIASFDSGFDGVLDRLS